jgi:sugar lactone lactonase YvrE
VTGERSYPGILFRLQSEENYERFYIRPHRAGLYPDALQYTPVINKVAGWQLYHGDGYTAGAELPAEGWIRLRLEVKGQRARVFVNGGSEPALEIDQLEHGVSKGAIGVMGPRNGTAYFSNFRYQTGDGLVFDPPPPASKPEPETITEWKVSRGFPADRARTDRYPHFYTIFLAEWKVAASDASGLVDIARHVTRENQNGDIVLARSVFRSDAARDVTLSFGYSDDVDLFVNGRRVFSGRSGYQSRDRSFLGIVGLNDAVSVRFEKGLNEVLLMVAERFGGWGFMMKADTVLEPPLEDLGRTTKVWETDDVFLTPESVLYDSDRELLYVTSFDNQFAQKQDPSGYVSKLSLDGEVIEHQWVTGLTAPTGMDIHRDTLWLCERRHLTAIDLESGQIAARFEIPDADFPNDLVIDDEGYIYIADTRPSGWDDSRIYRFRDGEFEVWANDGISRANGLWVRDGYLIVGNSGDGFLKRVRLSDARVERESTAYVWTTRADSSSHTGRGKPTSSPMTDNSHGCWTPCPNGSTRRTSSSLLIRACSSFRRFWATGWSRIA